MDEFITKASLAKVLGISRQAVHQHLASGKIKGVQADGKVDKNIAMATFRQNVQSHRAPKKDLDLNNLSENVSGTSREIKERFEALTVKAEYERLIGLLIPVDLVKRTVTTNARMTRDRLMSIPDRVSTVFVGLSADQIHSKLYSEIEQALNELTKEEEQDVVNDEGEDEDEEK